MVSYGAVGRGGSGGSDRTGGADASGSETIRNTHPATPPAMNCASQYFQMFEKPTAPWTIWPSATAGLKAPPEIPPTANAPASTVKPIASP